MTVKPKPVTREADASPFAGLPPIMRVAAEVGGFDAAIAIVRARGGRWDHIPKRFKPGHWLLATVNRDTADAIAREFGGSTHFIPNGRRLVARAAAAKVLLEGGSFNDAVDASGLHFRTVRRVNAKLRAGNLTEVLFGDDVGPPEARDTRQLNLF